MIHMWENEWFFFLALGVLGLLLLYWFRRRGARFLTGGIFLWSEGSSESRLTSRIAIQKVPLSFFLEAGAVLMLACGAAGLVTSAVEEFPPAVVVLNNAYSMKGGSRAEGCRMVKKYLDRFPGRRVIWLRCGREIELLNFSDSKFDFEKHWDCDDPEFDAGKAVAFAGKNFPGAEIVMVSDRLPEPFKKGRWTLLASGTPGDNIAFSDARIKGGRILLEISSFSDREMKVDLKLNDRHLDSFAIKKDERKILNFRLAEPPEKLKFTLSSPGDLLEYDNELLLLNIPASPVAYKLGKDLAPEEKKVLSEVLEGNPDFTSAVNAPELLIDRYSKEKRKAPGHKLFFHKGKSLRYVSQTPFFRGNEKILEGLSSSSLKWAFYSDVKIPGKGIIFSPVHPLFSVEKTKVSEYAYHLNLATLYSNLHHLPFWPGFFFNLGEFCRRHRPGPRDVNLRSGELFYCNSAGEKGTLFWEGENVKGETAISGGKSMLLLKKRGIYTLRDGKQKFTVSVNPQITSFSDLRRCRKGADYSDFETLNRGTVLKKWSRPFIMGALLLLVFNWCWNFRSRK